MIAALLAAVLCQSPAPAPATTKEAMMKVQLVVGEWKCTAMPKEMEGQRPWTEKASWTFKIEKDDYRLELTVKDGVFWKGGTLAYDVEKKIYRFTATLPSDEKRAYEGSYREKEKTLALEQTGDAWPKQKLVFSLLRDNRYLVDLEEQSAKEREWTVKAQVGCTKEGVPFAKGTGPLCVVTGGAGSISVPYKGKTYYVC